MAIAGAICPVLSEALRDDSGSRRRHHDRHSSLGPATTAPPPASRTPDTLVAAGLDLQLGLDPLTGNRYLFAAANPVMFFDDGHGPQPQRLSRCSRDGRCSYPTAPEERLSRRRPTPAEGGRAPLPVARRGPTPDGRCFPFVINWRRSDGRCKGANKFTDWTQGSDSDKRVVEPGYNNPFSNIEDAIAQSDEMRYFQACIQGAAHSALTGAPEGPGAAAIGGVTGCGVNIAEMAALDAGYSPGAVQYIKVAITVVANVVDVRNAIKNWPNLRAEGV